MFHLSHPRRVNNWKRMTDIFRRGYSKQAASESLEAACLWVVTEGTTLFALPFASRSWVSNGKSGGCQTENRSSFLVR